MPWFGSASVLTALSLVAAACSGAAGHDGDGHGEPPSTTAVGAVRVGELLGYGRADPPAGVFVDVSAGRFRTCGVRGDGSLACWGEAVGEIPEGRFTRVDIVDYGDAPYSSDAPAADGYGCAVRVDGSPACWGDDGVEPLEPPAEDFVDERAACALTAAGSAACWGDLAPQADGAVVEGRLRGGLRRAGAVRAGIGGEPRVLGPGGAAPDARCRSTQKEGGQTRAAQYATPRQSCAGAMSPIAAQRAMTTAGSEAPGDPSARWPRLTPPPADCAQTELSRAGAGCTSRARRRPRADSSTSPQEPERACAQCEKTAS